MYPSSGTSAADTQMHTHTHSEREREGDSGRERHVCTQDNAVNAPTGSKPYLSPLNICHVSARVIFMMNVRLMAHIWTGRRG